MSRYIDDDESQYTILYKTGIEKQGIWEDVINKTPTADVVEVVRCKDCKNYRKDIPCVGGQYNGCVEWLDEGCEAPVEEDDYCSYGKKRDD